MYREYRIGPRRMKIFLGDITDLQVDAIVNSENNDLIMDRADGPSVSAAIRRRSAEGYAEQVAALGPIDLGKAVITPSSGSLRCRYVIHAAVVRRRTPTNHDTEPAALRASVRSSLEVAGALGLRSVALPAFGVRSAQVPKEMSSDLMIEEVVRVLHGETSLDEVIFALLDPESFLVFFERAILRYVEYSAPIQLSAAVVGGHVEIRLDEGGPVAARDLVPRDEGLLSDVAGRFEALQSAAQRRLVDGPGRLRSLGGFLWNFLLPPTIRERLESSRAANLILRLDERLMGIPLELAWDGRSFLAERFRIGRQVAMSGGPTRGAASAAGGAVILCDPAGDLPGAHAEGVALFRLLAERGRAVELRGGGRATRGALMATLAECRVLHFSGHGRAIRDGAERGHAWELADGALDPGALAGGRARPGLVFSNACGADPESLLGGARLALGRAFLSLGAQHFIGALWEIDDRRSRRFALAFYEALLDGRDAGDALRAGRAAIKSGDGSIDWAAYVHFGDPRGNPLQQ